MTTGDFEMYNKDVVTTGNGNFVNSEGKYSTSAVDMDQSVIIAMERLVLHLLRRDRVEQGG